MLLRDPILVTFRKICPKDIHDFLRQMTLFGAPYALRGRNFGRQETEPPSSLYTERVTSLCARGRQPLACGSRRNIVEGHLVSPPIPSALGYTQKERYVQCTPLCHLFTLENGKVNFAKNLSNGLHWTFVYEVNPIFTVFCICVKRTLNLSQYVLQFRAEQRDPSLKLFNIFHKALKRSLLYYDGVVVNQRQHDMNTKNTQDRMFHYFQNIPF